MTDKQQPVLLELAHLPREQVGPFMLLGLDKDADTKTIEAHWAERIKWARRQLTNITLEEINWARETINDPQRRLEADVNSLNADTTESLLAQLASLYSIDESRRGSAWTPIDVEKPLEDYEPAIDVPDLEAARASVVLPRVPQQIPDAGRFLQELSGAPLDPWELQL